MNMGLYLFLGAKDTRSCIRLHVMGVLAGSQEKSMKKSCISFKTECILSHPV